MAPIIVANAMALVKEFMHKPPLPIVALPSQSLRWVHDVDAPQACIVIC
jgi:hypothetical protein